MRKGLMMTAAAIGLICLAGGSAHAQSDFGQMLSLGFEVHPANVHGEVIFKVMDPQLAAKIKFTDLAAWMRCHRPEPFAAKYFLIDTENVLQDVAERGASNGPRSCGEVDVMLDQHYFRRTDKSG
jgi:hypothetical protein